MKEIKLTQGKVALVDDADYDYLNQWKWHCYTDGYNFYAVRNYWSNGKRTAMKMHRIIMGVDSPKQFIDHKDHNGCNNQRENLRLCSRSQNNSNRENKNIGTSKYKGVVFFTINGKWMARLQSNGSNFFLGYFTKESDAALAYNEAAIKHHGEFANLNKF